MQLEVQKLLFDRLGKDFSELGFDIQVVPGSGGVQVGDTIRMLVPVTDEGEVVLMEVMVAGYFEDVDLLQFYSTMIMEIGPGYDELQRATNEMNFFCPLGSFGIFEEGRQYYHKYGILLEAPHSIEEISERVMTALEGVYDVLSKHFKKVTALSEGAAE